METDSPPMPDAADLADSQSLADGDIGKLLARYESVIRLRCIAQLRGSLDAEDVAQDVRVRLLNEFRRGKRYGGLPYRVVVHQVIGWTVADYFAGRRTDAPLPEDWAPVESGDPASEVVSRGWVEWVVAQVDGKDGQIIAMRYRDLLEPAEIAERLEMEPNAVHQAIYRGLGKIRELLHA
jgi:DNA-directed RNA polymerase specialized sigma24 family protein